MNKLLLVIVLLLHAPAHANGQASAAAEASSPAGSAYSEQQFDAVYQHLKRMLAQMERIKAAKDPQERQRLLQEHRQAMRDGAMALRRMDCTEGNGMECQRRSMPRGGHDRMGMMERRMDMMQMMMEQMIEHEHHKVPVPRQDAPGARE